MQTQTKANLTDRNIWTRGIYTLIFVVAYAVAEALITLVAIFQFLMALITGRVNEALQQFGANLTQYAYQIFQYVTFNSEAQPFPFSDWPDVPVGETPWSVEQAVEQPDEQADEVATASAETPPNREPTSATETSTPSESATGLPDDETPDLSNPPRPPNG